MGLLLENEAEIVCVPRSQKRVEMRLGGKKCLDHKTLLVTTSSNKPERRDQRANQTITREGREFGGLECDTRVDFTASGRILSETGRILRRIAEENGARHLS